MSSKRVALVTGGNRGIGKSISRRLAADGLTLALSYYSDALAAEHTVAELREEGFVVKKYQVDIADRAAVEELIRQVITDWGRIDVLVNNAGIASQSTTVDLQEEEWNRVMNVNLTGTFFCSQAVIPVMRQQKSGRIINLSSIAGQTGGRIGPHYAASKAGIIGLTRFMARELGPLGITVNAIAPSGIATDLLFELALSPSEDRPVQRHGTPEDVAAAVSYLASDDASYITGQLIAINGGSFIG